MSIFRSRGAIVLCGVVATALSTAAAASTATTTVAGTAYTMPAGDRAGGSAGASATVTPALVPGGLEALAGAKASGRVSEVESTQIGDAAQTGAAEFVIPGNDKFLQRVCKTNPATGTVPSDIHGAAGNQNLVVVTSGAVGVYNKKNCSLISRVTLEAFFAAAGVPASATIIDPRVVYDRANKRFVVTATSRDSNNNNQYQYVAVSTNTTGRTYNQYRITLSAGGTLFCKRKTGNVWDYPSVGSSRGRWYITANDTSAKNTKGAILSMDKAPTLTGAAAKVKCFNNQVVNIAPPIVLDTAKAAVFLSVGGGSGKWADRLVVTESNKGAQRDTLEAINRVDIPFWSAAPDAPQPNGQRLATLDGRFQSASIQSRNLIWNVHTVNAGETAKVRIYRLSTVSADVVPSLIFQPTTVGPNERDFLFNASLATSSGRLDAPIFVTLNRTVPAKSNGRAAQLILQGLNNTADSAFWRYAVVATSRNEMTGCNALPAGACAWGDYSSTQVDPSLGSAERPRAWGFNQLVGPSSPFDETDWMTRAGLVTTVVVP